MKAPLYIIIMYDVMNPKNIALRIAGILFGVVSVLHLLRVIFVVSVEINGWLLPIWLNWIGFFVTGFLSGWLWALSGRKNG